MIRGDCKLYPGEGGFKQYFSDDFPRTIWDNANAQYRWNRCPNIKETSECWDSTDYGCEVCGYSYTLYEDDMK